MKRIVVIGSLNADFVIRLQRFPGPGETVAGRDFKVFCGGKGANQACGAARLGGEVSMIGQVGNDAHGDLLIENLAAAGVDVTHIFRAADVSTGVAAITINAEGENQIVVVPGANGSFGEEQLQRSRELIASAGIVLLQLEIAARLAKAAGALVILDPAPAQQLPEDLLGSVDYLTPNESELGILTGTAAEGFSPAVAAQKAGELRKRGVRKVLVKMGAQGALLVDGQQETFWRALPVSAVDTTAAGDAFNAAFAYALASGQSELDAGRFATAAAAYSVTRAGAQPSMPTRAEVESLSATPQIRREVE